MSRRAAPEAPRRGIAAVRSRAEPMDTAELREGLLRPEAYPHPVEEVGFLQTHASLLFFAAERVYKVKKPVDLGFLDFTTLDRRRHFCEEEVRLNHRLAPGVYLGVVPIVAARGGGLRVGGDGEPLEWAVEMVRLPEHRMLSHLLERGDVDNEKLGVLASVLAAFHAEAATGEGVDEHGTPAAITANVEENFDQIRPYSENPGKEPAGGFVALSARQLAFLRTRGRGFLATHRRLLEERVREGRVREGHGDLHAGNICFTEPGPVVYDRIEFNRRFRCGDVASDLAFLAMDLDYRGYPSFSRFLVRLYARATGDRGLASVADFYKAYRAIVRGKVACMTAADPAVAEERRTELRREAMRYLQLAVSYDLPPALVILCGLPGSGKSWLAKRLKRPLRATLFLSDVRRKVLSGRREGVDEGYGAGLYAPERKRAVYRSLLEDAIDHLASGQSVIVDATFSRRDFRAPFVDAAVRMELPYYVVHVSAADEVIRERIERRQNETRAVSDADLDVYLREREAFEAPSEIPGGHVLEVVTDEILPEEASSTLLDRMIVLTEEDHG